jgi:hypothetical protein
VLTPPSDPVPGPGDGPREPDDVPPVRRPNPIRVDTDGILPLRPDEG